MKSAIVTGANGFIGSAVCRALLKRGVEVYALVYAKDAFTGLGSHPNLRVLESGMADYPAIAPSLPQDADAFYHFAWEGSSGATLADYSMQIRNIQYTCDALTLAAQIHCKKFIMAGTINELELLQFFHAERQVPRPACIYGTAKLACDLMCKTIAAQKDILFNCAIIGSCFGPGDRSKRIHNAFIHGMLVGKAPKLVQAETLHDWIYIDDVADMFCEIGQSGVHMKNYYLGHDHLRPLRDILLEVRDILNPGLEIKFGEVPDSFVIDYSQVEIDGVYRDTGYRCNSDFAQCIRKTAEHVKTLSWE